MGVGMQIIAFFTLVVVQSGAILLFRLAQSNGAYSFSPASAVALTEFVKLVLAVGSHWLEVQQTGSEFFPNLSLPIVLHYFGLSCLYTTNNILTFFVLQLADPGTLSLFKSIAPYLCAIMLRCTGQRLNRLQWCCVLIQCCSIAIVQYDVEKGVPVLQPRAYILLTIATCITATSSVWNQLVIKGFEVPLNLQNTMLYTFGLLTSIGCYFFGPAKSDKGFLEGYGLLAWALVLFQALHGLAVSFVYKHADAIVKNFANSSVMAVLVVVSAIWFGLNMNLHSALAVVIIVVTTYIYMAIAIKMKDDDLGDTIAESAKPAEQQALMKAIDDCSDGDEELADVEDGSDRGRS